MIQLTRDKIDAQALLDRVTTPAVGAVVLFLGTVRELTHGRRTLALDYECYPAMAEKKLAELEAEARRRWPIADAAIVHRLGRLELCEASVAVAVGSPHRAAAFEAGRWLIDELKQVVPIWKQENWSDGTTEWVHPGVTNSELGTRNSDLSKACGSAPEFRVPSSEFRVRSSEEAPP